MIINPIVPIWVMILLIPLFIVCLSRDKKKRIRQIVIIVLIFLINIRIMIRNEDAEVITIIGPKGTITKKCCIIAARHIHTNNFDNLGYDNNDIVSVKFNDTIISFITSLRLLLFSSSIFLRSLTIS